jgi:hypothetical protein
MAVSHHLKATIVAAISSLALVAASPAQADVLIEAPYPLHKVCGDAITTGIWAQPGTTGSRTVLMYATDVQPGRIWWTKRGKAYSSRWRRWYLPSGWKGYCGTTRVTYALLAPTHGVIWRDSYTVRFRPEEA